MRPIALSRDNDCGDDPTTTPLDSQGATRFRDELIIGFREILTVIIDYKYLHEYWMVAKRPQGHTITPLRNGGSKLLLRTIVHMAA